MKPKFSLRRTNQGSDLYLWYPVNREADELVDSHLTCDSKCEFQSWWLRFVDYGNKINASP